MPGVITAVYLTDGDGRKSDEELGDQDEIDIEFRVRKLRVIGCQPNRSQPRPRPPASPRRPS
jgi:hypothetical protein